ncbi:MAG: type II 3-dehydroquinate dehydratase [Clostridiales bacterium]|nr:type II 3-dehydroquinate dehydratase [Clostridiales bacterium]
MGTLSVLVINGPNINMLGSREPDIYGRTDYQQLVLLIEKWAAELGMRVECRQSNHEGDIVDWIQDAPASFDAIVINPAAYTHTSIAILDALNAVCLPAVEVHISDVTQREDFRQISYAGMACEEHIIGRGVLGYRDALNYLAARDFSG